MTVSQAKPMPEGPEPELLRDELARSTAVLGKIAPILGHLLSTPDQSLFNDEVIARVRGMLQDLAFQMLRIQAEATGHAGREEFAAQHGAELAELLQGNAALLAHCHALALEWQLTARLEMVYGLDPVLCPLIQELVGHEDSAIASTAMAALAAQARFAQTQRRMELPLAELPGELLHETLLGWRNYNGDKRSDAMTRAEAKIRGSYDEGTGRLALFARLVASLGDMMPAMLSVDEAGVAIFLTALAYGSGQTRELAVLSTNERQVARLALGLRAADLAPDAVGGVVLRLHPDGDPPMGFSSISVADARELLAENAMRGVS